MLHRQKKLQLINNGEDRLSSLPDDLLITILSLLPFSSTVAISVLYRRWRHLWTHCTRITFDFSCSFLCRTYKIQESINTINDVISKLTSPKLHSFHLYLCYFANACSSILVPSFEAMCSRNPEVIRLLCNEYHQIRLSLPTSLFRTQSLVELELDQDFDFEFDFADDQIVINLPNLKELRLSLHDSHRRLMRTLFKSCPQLERLDLNLYLKEKDHYVDVLAPNLKFLTIESYFDNCLLIIDAPKLEHLETSGDDPSMFYHFVKNIRCLQEADIIIPGHGVGDENDYRAKILALFQGISCVRSLTLHQFFSDHLSDFALPIFHNLVHLSFSGSDLDSGSWVPSCLLSNVKSLKISHIELNEHRIRLLQHILCKATVLEHLQVYDYYMWDIPQKTRLWKEYKFIMKLFKFPRSSSSCQIELSGDIISASNKDFSYGKLTCKLQGLIWDSDSE